LVIGQVLVLLVASLYRWRFLSPATAGVAIGAGETAPLAG
jgi:hypothetical protein